MSLELPSQLGAVVAERELKLRQALRTMGMLDSAFWLSWASTELILVRPAGGDFVTMRPAVKGCVTMPPPSNVVCCKVATSDYNVRSVVAGTMVGMTAEA
jgi:hypothetical protein